MILSQRGYTLDWLSPGDLSKRSEGNFGRMTVQSAFAEGGAVVGCHYRLFCVDVRQRQSDALEYGSEVRAIGSPDAHREVVGRI